MAAPPVSMTSQPPTHSSIVLYTQMLAQNALLNQTGADSDRAGKHIRVVKQPAQQVVQLIQQILDFSRSAMLDRKSLDLAPLLKEQVRLLARMLPQSIKMHFIHVQGQATRHADPTHVSQVEGYGVHGWLAKPPDLDELARTLAGALRKNP
jgi:signal transduction histidine kinase